MKFKVLKGSDLYALLMGVKKQMEDADAAAKLIVKEVGAEGYSCLPHKAYGGIAAFYFKDGSGDPKGKPGWKKMESGYSHWFFPLAKEKSNKDLLDRIYALPKIDYDTINEPFKYGNDLKVVGMAGGGFGISHTPGIVWGTKEVLVSVPEGCGYKPVAGMIEITGSEYEKIEKKINKTKQK